MSVKNPKIELKYGEAGVADPPGKEFSFRWEEFFSHAGESDLPLEKDVS
jgi:hypothetical protein